MDDSLNWPPRLAALRFLCDRIDYERSRSTPYTGQAYKLDRMRELLARLGNPQDRLAIVHVAGTKGKGSVAAMTAASLTAAGYRTGLFTSPHLERIEERIAIDSQPCSGAELVDLVERVRAPVSDMDARAARMPGEMRPTYFELTTALALLHFERCQVDAAVLEVGMGGRLDSTNVCTPRVSVITSISFDHTQQLGSTLAMIAREKGGIIKPGVPVVSGVCQEEPREVIAAMAAERGCRLLERDRDFGFTYRAPSRLDQAPNLGELDYWSRHGAETATQSNIPLGLLGSHQAANAAVALATLEELGRQGWSAPLGVCKRALSDLRWPARVEVIHRRPCIVLDSAHNVASMEALLATLDECFTPSPRWLVLAASRDKDAAGMLARLLPRFEKVLFTAYESNPRAVPPQELAALATSAGRSDAVVCPSPAAAWDLLRQQVRPQELVCVTGSFFIAADMRRAIEAQPWQPSTLEVA